MPMLQLPKFVNKIKKISKRRIIKMINIRAIS